jgi:hypothetical protein
VRARGCAVTTIAVMALACSIAGCSGSEPQADDVAASTLVSTDVEVQAPDEGADVASALDFRAPLVGGGEFDGADYAGQPVVFWFWAPT